MERKIVAVDGPAASGKSTVSRAVARALGAVHVDSGSYYRCVTWHARRRDVDTTDEDAVMRLVADSRWDVLPKNGAVELFVDGDLPGEALRTEDVNSHVSAIAAMPRVRKQVVEWLQQTREHGDLVMEGRDIGTVVFPDTPYKFYLEASAEERARRRHAEMATGEQGVSVKDIDASLRRRDRIDSTRKADPLRMASGAEMIDSTDLGPDEVVALVLSRVSG